MKANKQKDKEKKRGWGGGKGAGGYARNPVCTMGGMVCPRALSFYFQKTAIALPFLFSPSLTHRRNHYIFYQERQSLSFSPPCYSLTSPLHVPPEQKTQLTFDRTGRRRHRWRWQHRHKYLSLCQSRTRESTVWGEHREVPVATARLNEQ